MELRHLRYFVAVAEELNFRRAAQRLFMEQPPLSRQIQQLEREMGVPLFRRIKRHIELTAAGCVFLEEARHTLAQADHAVHAAQQAGWEQANRLAVGLCFCIDKSSYTFDSAFPKVVQTFRRQRPDVALTLTEMCSSVQAQALREGRIDVGFLQIPVTDESIECHGLLQEPLVLALPQSHPLATLPNVPLSALAQERFLLFPEHVYPSLHREIMAACARAGFRPHVVQEVVSAQMAVGLVGAGMGVAFAGAGLAGTPGVAFRAVPDFPLSLELSVAWRRDSAASVLSEFVDLARKIF